MDKKTSEAKRRVRIQKNDYEICDMCHKAKPSAEIERVVVVYRRCEACSHLENQIQGSDMPQEVRPKTIMRGMRTPPAVLREAFNMPPELRKQTERSMAPQVPMISDKPNGQGTTNGDDASTTEGKTEGAGS
jgi:hypothetical protein